MRETPSREGGRKVQMRTLQRESADLLRAIGQSRTQAPASRIRSLVQKITRWDEMMEGARLHGLLPALYLQLSAIPESIPVDVLQRAKREFERNAFHCMTNAEELLKILKEFQEAGVAAIPFKGVVLGATAYGDMTARNAGDLDLLIHYRDLRRATEILKSRGYELKTKTLEDGSPEAANYFEFHFERPSDGMVVELRWRLELTQPEYRKNIGLDWAMKGERTAVVAGAEVPNLDPVTSLLVLCMHGSKHAWSRWMWVCDVARLIENEPGIDWNLALEEAKCVGLSHCLALGVLLANRGTGVVIPESASRALKTDRAMSKLADFFCENALEHPGALPRAMIPYHLQIIERGDRIRAIFSLSLLRPNELDKGVVRLPKSLSLLYYIIRPVRLLADRLGH